jgi:hypothetical protein
MAEDYLKRLIYDLMYYRKAPIGATVAFAKSKHNDDLVPAFDRQLDQVIELFDRYHRVVYDTQGLRDHGIDVIARYKDGNDEEGPMRYIGLQIKSNDDFEQDYWLKGLKAQIYEAKVHANMEDFYVIPCTDAIAHREKLRNLRAEVAFDEQTHLVDPEFALSFLRLSAYEMGAYLKLKLAAGDVVVREATDLFVGYTISEAAIVVELAIRHFLLGDKEHSVSQLRDSLFLQAALRRYPDVDIDFFHEVGEAREEAFRHQTTLERFQGELEGLETDLIESSSVDDRIILNADRLHPVGALILDGSVRYGWDEHHLREYLLHTLVADKIETVQRYEADRKPEHIRLRIADDQT